MIAWGGERAEGGVEPIVFYDTGGRYDPATDAWTPTSTVDAPTARAGHTAVWTGAEMIVWGGTGFQGEDIVELRSGGRYDPTTDSWRPLAETGAPEARTDHGAVWTGAEMIVWGGFGRDSLLTDGARYDPASDTWTPVSTDGAPEAQPTDTVVWTGAEMIVWRVELDGSEVRGGGARYDPASDSWSPIARDGAPAANGQAAGVARGKLLVWDPPVMPLTARGGVYDPDTDAWAPMSRKGAPAERLETTGAATEDGLIVWGGFKGRDGEGVEYLQTGGVYSLADDSWQAITTVGAPIGRDDASLVWTGSQLIVWAGYGDDRSLRSGGRWAP